MAIAPPFTLTRSGSSPSSRITTRLCEAKASFSSTRSSSPISTPARSSSFRTAGTGPMPVARDVADRHELVGEAARLVGGGPTLLRLQRERVLVLARDAVALGDVLAGL